MKTAQPLIQIFPKSSNNSLRAWSAADELIIQELSSCSIVKKDAVIINDTYGYLSTHLFEFNPQIITERYSQKEAIRQNLTHNALSYEESIFTHILDHIKIKPSLCIFKMPKSKALFDLYLRYIINNSQNEVQVIAGFMTKYFSKEWLNIAAQYFHKVEQSKAYKKARLLKLSDPKASHLDIIKYTAPFKITENESWLLTQFGGVFSQNHIDYGTQFLLNNISLDLNVKQALDLCSGNGIIAKYIRHYCPDAQIHLIDDSYLAIKSSQLNLGEANFKFHWNNSLESISDNSLDLILCNPPFHSGTINTNEIAIALFKESYSKLKENGQMYIVANIHLNYKTQIIKFFKSVSEIKRNEKFLIYLVRK